MKKKFLLLEYDKFKQRVRSAKLRLLKLPAKLLCGLIPAVQRLDCVDILYKFGLTGSVVSVNILRSLSYREFS